MPTKIHPTAIIEPGAQIGHDVEVGPFCVVGPHCILHDRVVLKGNVWLDGNTTIGESTEIWPGAVIGTKTQDLKFRGEKTSVVIGKSCQIREFVTINSSCQEGSCVKVGDNCLLMAYCHIAHNCELGNRVIMSNNATLAGHVIVEDCAVIGGLAAVHQYCRIGKYAMVGGMSRVTHDVPPYTIGAGSPYRLGGLNLVGLKRHKIGLRERKLLVQLFKIMYRMPLTQDEAIHKIECEVERIPEVEHFLAFCKLSKRGLIGRHGLKKKCVAQDDELGI